MRVRNLIKRGLCLILATVMLVLGIQTDIGQAEKCIVVCVVGGM